MTFRPIKEEVIGGHMHRSGWPYVLNSLNPLFDEKSKFVFDDFLEKTICNQRVGYKKQIHEEPWVGICHYPFDSPSWYETEHLSELSSYESWPESISNLQLCITLGEELAAWIRMNWNVPAVALKHPTEIPIITWSKENFIRNTDPLLIQVGWYLRNTHAIYQVPTPDYLTKAWLRSGRPIAERNHALCQQYFCPKRSKVGMVHVIDTVNNDDYDILLSRNIIFVELITSVANNTVIECIARNTPIVINRHPGPEYYLGKKYPFFYDNINEVPDLIKIDKIIEAHEYLKDIDKTWLSGSNFRDRFSKECIKHLYDKC